MPNPQRESTDEQPADAAGASSRGGGPIALPSTVIDAYRNEKLAILVGSGLSVECGLPRWRELPNKLLDYVERHCQPKAQWLKAQRAFFESPTTLKAMLQRLDEIKGVLTDDRRYQAALNAIFAHKQGPSDVHRALADLDVKLLVTTNYDNLLEADTSRTKFTWKTSDNALSKLESADGNILFKIHGTAELDDTVVLTKNDYDHLEGHKQYQAVFGHLLQTYTFLFIGYGVNDPYDLDLVLEGNSNGFGGASKQHFALMKQFDGVSDNDRARWHEKLNVRVVGYAEHTEIVAILRGLHAEGSPSQALPRVSGLVGPSANDAHPIWAKRPSKATRELVPDDLLDMRASSCQKFYYERAHDRALREHIRGRKHVIVIGNSLSGKTRTVFEALAREPDAFVIFPSVEGMHSGFRVPESKGARLIAFLDDIDDYCVQKSINSMLTDLMRRGVQVVATCRTGPEYDAFESRVTTDFRDQVERVLVPKVTDSELDAIVDHVVIEDKGWNRFDSNVGSLFLPLTKMGDRYKQLSNSRQIGDDLSRTILRSLKLLYLSGNFVNKSTYVLARLKDLCERTHMNTQLSFRSLNRGTTMQRAMIPLLKPAYDAFEKSWPDALARLMSDDRNLNFLESHGKEVRVEEAYLDLIIDPQLSIEDAQAAINERYPDDREACEFFTNVELFDRRIAHAPSYEEALAIFDELLAAKLRPTRASYNGLIAKATTYQVALSHFERMSAERFSSDISTFYALVCSASSHAELTDLLDRMARANVVPRDAAFSLRLRQKGLDFEQLRALGARILACGGVLDPEMAQELVQSARTFQDAYAALTKLEALGYPPTPLTLLSVIALATSPEQATTVMSRFKKQDAGSPPSAHKLNAEQTAIDGLLRGCASLPAASDVLMRLAWVGMLPHESTACAIAERADSFQEARDFLERSGAWRPTGYSTAAALTLLKKASPFEQALSFVSSLLAQPGEPPDAALPVPDEKFFRRLIEKAKSLEQAQTARELYVRVHPGSATDEVACRLVIQKADFEHARRIVAGLEVSKIPERATYEAWVQRATSLSQGREAVAWMQGVDPKLVSGDTFNLLIQKAQSFEQGLELLAQMQEQGFDWIPHTFFVLSNKALTFEAFERVLSLMATQRIPETPAVLNTFLMRARTQSEVESALERLARSSLQPTDHALRTLLTNNDVPYCVTASILDRFGASGLSSDKAVLCALTCKARTESDARDALGRIQQACPELVPLVEHRHAVQLIVSAASIEQSQAVWAAVFGAD